MNNHDPLTPKEAPQNGVHVCDVGDPVDSKNIWLKMPRRSNPGFALACRTGVNKGPGFWFALLLSLLSCSRQRLMQHVPDFVGSA